ncbi:MAG: DUF4388 domain-containing protein [Thermomicrobiaceae bacterium]
MRNDVSPNGTVGTEYDLQGKLGVFTLSDLFQMLSFSNKSGVLTLIQGWNSRTITFQDGRISYVAAGSRLPSMRDLLMRKGKVSREQVDDLTRRGVHSDEAVVAELIRREMIGAEDVTRCREQLLEISIFTLFLWRNCQFTFKSGESVREGGVDVSVDSMHLIIEGTRRVDEWIEISPIVPSVYMIYRRASRPPGTTPPRELRAVHRLIDGNRDVATIAARAGLTQFETARALFDLVKWGYVEAIPPDKQKVTELFNMAIESIYFKLILFSQGKTAVEFENQLNRFAMENGLKVRMSRGKVLMSDQRTPIMPAELVDLYKLFIAIQNNKFSKVFDPVVSQGLMEGLYLHTDPEFQAMMRMYEFIEIEGLLMLEMFERKQADGAVEPSA